MVSSDESYFFLPVGFDAVPALEVVAFDEDWRAVFFLGVFREESLTFDEDLDDFEESALLDAIVLALLLVVDFAGLFLAGFALVAFSFAAFAAFVAFVAFSSVLITSFNALICFLHKATLDWAIFIAQSYCATRSRASLSLLAMRPVALGRAARLIA